MSMPFPKVVALDTDWTIWQNYLSHRTWGKLPWAASKVEDNIQRYILNRKILRDKSNIFVWIRVYDDISRIVNDIVKNNAKLAIVSRNSSKSMSDRALYYFNTTNPKENGKECSIIDLVDYDEVVDEPKVLPFRRIQGWSEADFSDMLMFDDKAAHNAVRIELGVTFQLVRRGDSIIWDGKGLSWDCYQRGLDAWRRVKAIQIPPSPSSVSKRVLIGYSGLPTFWINLVGKREGIIDNSIPYRWGFGLYVAASMPIARYFTKFNDIFMKDPSQVCEVWVNDYDIWKNINKIWVPEHSGLMQMNNMGWPAGLTALNQESRDRSIAAWGVHAPYVLFSRHHGLPGLPTAEDPPRWTEMVIPTQIQRALIDVVPLNDTQMEQITGDDLCPYPFHQQIKEWNITVRPEARFEFWLYRERELHKLSAPSES